LVVEEKKKSREDGKRSTGQNMDTTRRGKRGRIANGTGGEGGKEEELEESRPSPSRIMGCESFPAIMLRRSRREQIEPHARLEISQTGHAKIAGIARILVRDLCF
jgi:hypothetical protein